MRYRSSILKGGKPSECSDVGVALSAEETDNECLATSIRQSSITDSALNALCSNSEIAWLQWQPEICELKIEGYFNCDSLEEWLSFVEESDREKVTAFFEQDWRKSSGIESIEYRIFPGGCDVPPLRVCHTAAVNQNARSPLISGLIRPSEKRDATPEWASFVASWQETGCPELLSSFRESLHADAIAILEISEGGAPEILSLSAEPDEDVAVYTNSVIEVLEEAGPEINDGAVIDDSKSPYFHFVRSSGSLESGCHLAFVAVFPDEKSATCSSNHLVAALLLESTRRRCEAKVREELEEMLAQSQRFSSIGRLATGVAHDFNNLLTVIRGHTSFLELAAEDCKDPRMLESISLIDNATDQAVDLAKQLLHFGKDKEASFRYRNLNEIISNSARFIRRMLEEDVSLHLKLDDNPGLVRADSGMIGQILMNLVVNARDAMENGGRIQIKTKRVSGDCFEGSARSKDYLCLSITDNGPGIPPAILAKIFDPFFTTKREGNGIGLSNVAHLVERHGGTIDVRSEAGLGTTFEIYFPISEELRESGNPRTESKDATSGSLPLKKEEEEEGDISGSKVLLVEDEASVRMLVKKLLEMNGCTVIEASSGKKALDLWPEVCDDISVVVSDVVMPEGVSGWDLARALQEKSPHIGILLTSGYSEKPEDHGLDENPKIAFLQKPYEAKKLKSNVYDLLQQAAS